MKKMKSHVNCNNKTEKCSFGLDSKEALIKETIKKKKKKPKVDSLLLCIHPFIFLRHKTHQLRNSTREDKEQKMQKIQNYHLLLCFLSLNFFFCSSICHKTDPISCGKFQIQPPFLRTSPTGSFPLNHMILCRSHNLYFRTSIGLFPISKIDYITKTLIISHFPSSSSSTNFVSPSLLSSGLPSPPNLINSLLLFHCPNPTKPFFQPSQNCTNLPKFEPLQNPKPESPKESCLIFEDIGKLNKSFHPNNLGCSHYTRAYRNSSDFELRNGYKMGTVVSFDIPDHIPNVCNECERPDGHCGVALRCICHVLECKDKVFSEGGIVRPGGKFLFSLLAACVMIILLM